MSPSAMIGVVCGIWVLLAGASLFFAVAAWRGFAFRPRQLETSNRERHGLRYRYAERRAGLRFVGFFVSVAVPRALSFALHRERRFDLFGKWTGLTRELQTGDPTFDHAFYVDTADPTGAVLLRRQEVRDRLVSLPRRLREHEGRLHGLHCADGELHVEVRTMTVSEEHLRAQEELAIDGIAPLVAEIWATRPEGAAVSAPPPGREHTVRKVYLGPWLIGCAIAPAVIALSPASLVVPFALLAQGALVGGLLFLTFLVWAFRYVGQGPRRHWLLVEWLLLAAPGFVFTAALALRTANLHLDASPRERVTVTDPWLHETKATYPGTSTIFAISFDSDHPVLARAASRRAEYVLDRSTVARLYSSWHRGHGKTAVVELRRGALGHPWIAGVSPGP
ncbi:MAG TPA: hypothetical protein VGS57_02545 [Thermoanaerobaculia bacterium]|nr:hypothetical protein [Thermoanaerobaculia bacterium]